MDEEKIYLPSVRWNLPFCLSKNLKDSRPGFQRQRTGKMESTESPSDDLLYVPANQTVNREVMTIADQG